MLHMSSDVLWLRSLNPSLCFRLTVSVPTVVETSQTNQPCDITGFRWWHCYYEQVYFSCCEVLITEEIHLVNHNLINNSISTLTAHSSNTARKDLTDLKMCVELLCKQIIHVTLSALLVQTTLPSLLLNPLLAKTCKSFAAISPKHTPPLCQKPSSVSWSLSQPGCRKGVTKLYDTTPSH